MSTHTRKLQAEIDRLKSQIALLKAQNLHEKHNLAVVNERYKKVVLINHKLIGKNLLLREIVTTVAPELGACVN